MPLRTTETSINNHNPRPACCWITSDRSPSSGRGQNPKPNRMKNRSWKTTLAGIGAILTALGIGATAISEDRYEQLAAVIPGILAGIGLLAARDNDKTSEETGAKQAEMARTFPE